MAARHELVIASIPGRTGLYLGVMRNGAWHSIARFTRGEESAKEFTNWARDAGIRVEDDKEE